MCVCVCVCVCANEDFAYVPVFFCSRNKDIFRHPRWEKYIYKSAIRIAFDKDRLYTIILKILHCQREK